MRLFFCRSSGSWHRSDKGPIANTHTSSSLIMLRFVLTFTVASCTAKPLLEKKRPTTNLTGHRRFVKKDKNRSKNPVPSCVCMCRTLFGWQCLSDLLSISFSPEFPPTPLVQHLILAQGNRERCATVLISTAVVFSGRIPLSWCRKQPLVRISSSSPADIWELYSPRAATAITYPTCSTSGGEGLPIAIFPTQN